LDQQLSKLGQIVEKRRYPSPHPGISLYMVSYLSNGLVVKGLLAEPKESGVYDGFLYLRGGIKNVGTVRPSRIIQFASQGFVVFAPFYRGNQGGEGDEDFAFEDRWDAIAGFELLKRHPMVNPGRVHLFGFSRGGIMALWTAISCPDAASLVTWGGVSDMVLTYEERIDLRRMLKRVIGGSPMKYPDAYKARTPLYHTERISCDVLIIHGEDDENVSIQHAVMLEERLTDAQKQVETWYFPGFTHYFPPKVNRQIVRDLTKWMKETASNGTIVGK
jgi:dipeptidyl aminopeptidase/acylaminoacyl peptidase